MAKHWLNNPAIRSRCLSKVKKCGAKQAKRKENLFESVDTNPRKGQERSRRNVDLNEGPPKSRFRFRTSVNVWTSGIQCDQIGRFLKVLRHMVSVKSSPNAWWMFGLKWKATLLMLNYCGYFLGNFWKTLGYFFIQHLITLVRISISLSIFVIICFLSESLHLFCFFCSFQQSMQFHHK